jgi:Astacin (Peptidase family M12A)
LCRTAFKIQKASVSANLVCKDDIIFYFTHPVDQNQIDFLIREFGAIEEKTCIRFIPKTDEEDFIDIIDGGGCWSWLGRLGGRQELSMSRFGCFVTGTGSHEAIHALGYDHMHNSYDRDDYVDVIWENIAPGMKYNFEKVDANLTSNFNTSYDLLSIMHYPHWAFSLYGDSTIVPHNKSYLYEIGSKYISDGDFLRINNMYECKIDSEN